MAERLDRHYDCIRHLCTCDTKVRKAILEASNLDLVRTILDCVENILSGNVTIPEADKRALKRHRKVLRALRDKGKTLKEKKKLIIQRGGFLPALLGPLLGIIAGLIR